MEATEVKQTKESADEEVMVRVRVRVRVGLG